MTPPEVAVRDAAAVARMAILDSKDDRVILSVVDTEDNRLLAFAKRAAGDGVWYDREAVPKPNRPGEYISNIFPVRSPESSDAPQLVYAVTGGARENAYGGSVRVFLSIRVETHARDFRYVAGADAALILELERGGRLVNYAEPFDDYSSGIQPTTEAADFTVPIERADRVYRRIRTVMMPLMEIQIDESCLEAGSRHRNHR